MRKPESFHIGVLQRMAKKYSKIYNAGVQIFKVLNLSSHDGDAEDIFDCKNMNIYFKYESCEGSYLVWKTQYTSQKKTAPQTYCFYYFPRSVVLLFCFVLRQLCLLHQVRALARSNSLFLTVQTISKLNMEHSVKLGIEMKINN